MDRDYRFRGKRSDTGKWVYGDLITWWRGEGSRAICDVGGIRHDVIPETVGQFTGLRDKNGQELYEGDILQGGQDYEKIYGKPIVKIGEYIDNGLRHLDLCEDETFPLYGVYIETLWGPGGLSGDHELIKIGNIHDNPELLGGGPDDDI